MPETTETHPPNPEITETPLHHPNHTPPPPYQTRKKIMGINYKGEGGAGRDSGGPATPSSVVEAATPVSIAVVPVKKYVKTDRKIERKRI